MTAHSLSRPLPSRALVVLLFLAGSAVLAGCGTQPADDSPPSDLPASGSDSAAAPGPAGQDVSSLPLIHPSPRELPGELLDSAAVDLEGDGAAERVELRARIERDDRGRLMWDDGQEWSLVVVGQEGAYTLFDGWVQLGTLGFWLLESGGDAPVSIVSLEDAGAGVRVRRFDWLPEERAFRQVDVLEATGNVLHRPQEPS